MAEVEAALLAALIGAVAAVGGVILGSWLEKRARRDEQEYSHQQQVRSRLVAATVEARRNLELIKETNLSHLSDRAVEIYALVAPPATLDMIVEVSTDIKVFNSFTELAIRHLAISDDHDLEQLSEHTVLRVKYATEKVFRSLSQLADALEANLESDPSVFTVS